ILFFWDVRMIVMGLHLSANRFQPASRQGTPSHESSLSGESTAPQRSEGSLGGRSFSSDISLAAPGALAPEDNLAASVPFRRLYLHSLVRTAEGAKMSKTKGTGVDPLQLTQQY